MPGNDTTLGSTLRRHRTASGLTQEELAERAGISARTVSDVERGLRSTVYRDTAVRLASALALSDAERDQFLELARGRPLHARPGPEWNELAERPPPTASIPPQPTRLIGRENELEQVGEALADPNVRLLSVTGSGGVGKTRLSAEAAIRSHAEFPGGVFFVALAGNADPSLVLPAVARAVGVAGRPGEPVGAIAGALAGRRTLLLLDTFEHVLDAAPAVAELLAAAPGLVALVTSREALRLRGEREIALAPLAGPDPSTAAAADLARFPATALFLERARAVKPGLTIDEAGARAVAAICAALDGLPLAIELGAARVKHLPLPALREQLGERLQMLTGGPRDLPLRHRTMSDTVAWSYDLLDDQARLLFRTLSAFAGGWTLDAARAVAAPEGADLLAGLSALVDKSLVTLLPGTEAEPRWDMLDVVRDYAALQRYAHGESDTLFERLAAHFLALAERAEPELGRAAQQEWFERLEREHDNFRRALRWFIEERDGGDALRLAGALWQFWRLQGYLDEGLRWLRDALAKAPADSPARAKALWGAAWLAFHHGDHDDADALSRQLRASLGPDADLIERRNALTIVGVVAMARLRADKAVEAFRECVEICRALKPGWYLATSLLNLGMATMHATTPGDAEPFLEEARAMHAQIGDEHFAARSTLYLGHAALLAEDPVRARSRFAEGLRAFVSVSDRGGIAEALEGMSAVDAATGEPERAARTAGAAEALRERLTALQLPYDRLVTERYLLAARESLGNDAWDANLSSGRERPLDRAVGDVLGFAE